MYRSILSVPFAALLFSVTVHAAPLVTSAVFGLRDFLTFVQQTHRTLHEDWAAPYEVELKEEPPPEEKKPEEPPKELEPPSLAPPPKADKPIASPPAAAKAGQVLAAKDDEPVDFTKFTMVQGSGNVYAGGVTASSGTSNQAVTDRNARANGVVGGKGTSDAPPVDISRAAAPASRDWNCSHLFPAEADANDINSAVVSVVVTVQPNGAAQNVTVVNDPGHGFGRAARTCAMSQRYAPALDRAGQPTTGKTTPFTVRFTR